MTFRAKLNRRRPQPPPRRWRWPSGDWARRAKLALPLVIGVSVGAGGAAFPPSRDAAMALYHSMRVAVLSRPEFRIRELRVSGAENLADAEIVAALDLTEERRAALGFDARDARRRLEALGWVDRAEVTLKPPHTLDIVIQERRPALLWRLRGKLALLDQSGRVIADAPPRARGPNLPLIVGPGAAARAEQARALYKMAMDAELPVLGLTRIGGRRWDLELLNGPRIMLPEAAPEQALARAVRWTGETALLERGFSVIDLRLEHAPTARRAAGADAPRRPRG